jgi:hypothetical protein
VSGRRSRIERLEELLRSGGFGPRVCELCGAEDGGVVIFETLREDGTVDYDTPPCEGCDKIAAELGRINHVQFRDNTRPEKEIERQRAIGEEFEVNDE